MTRLLNPLEKMHIVEKQKNSRDARISLVHLTDAGLETYENSKQTYIQTADSLMSEVDIDTINAELTPLYVAI